MIQQDTKDPHWRYCTHASTLRYLDILDGLLEAYNSSIHSTTKMTPVSVAPHNSKEISARLYPPKKRIKAWKFEIGDKVCRRQARKAFIKGYLATWTEEIFTVKRRVATDLPTYEIADWVNEPVRGRFYAQEIQKIEAKEDQAFKVDKILKTKQEGGKMRYLVSWVGYPS